MVTIIDYGAGNTESVAKAVRFLGQACELTNDPEKLLQADRVILPGVGAFRDAMRMLRELHMEQAIAAFLKTGRPFLGICLGLQLLFESSEEAPGCAGLSLLPGRIVRIPAGGGRKVPHIGWNSLSVNPEAGLLQGLPPNPYVYFVHSYYLKAGRPEIVAARTEYGVPIDAAVQWENIAATQFHPEKSGAAGLKILTNFLNGGEER